MLMLMKLAWQGEQEQPKHARRAELGGRLPHGSGRLAEMLETLRHH